MKIIFVERLCGKEPFPVPDKDRYLPVSFTNILKAYND